MTHSSIAILERFRRNHGKDINLTLRHPYFDLLKKLGDPHLKLPPVVHVAGTNGKGSTCAFLRAIAEAAGYRAHVYTSPHLVTFHERIRIAGNLIEEDELVRILLECERLAEPGSVSYYEAATATAFYTFALYPADITIIETGLGGRLDGTNVIPRPFATIITRLSFDHREYLGGTMAEIAREKAGIMRPFVPCFSAPQPSTEALETLYKTAKEIGAPLKVGNIDWSVKKINNKSFSFVCAKHSFNLPLPALTGNHQIWNAGLAVAASAVLPLKITDRALKTAMHTVEWPGRLQKLSRGCLAEMLPPEWELWLDGGHNDSAAEILAEQMLEWRREDGNETFPLFIIIGMLSTKNPIEFVTPLLPYTRAWRTVDIVNEPLGLSSEDLANSVKIAGAKDVKASASITNAIKEVISLSKPKGRILICGSLYLIGEALRQNSA